MASVVQTGDVIRTDDEGLYGPKGKEHRIRGTILYQDVCANMGGKWKLTNTKTVKETTFVDGKLWKPKQEQSKE